ncbi:MAG: hypothetical protein E7510_11720 [Ruminococcus sp.]|nr:hypothetical protein [Ruminococcus sp.]
MKKLLSLISVFFIIIPCCTGMICRQSYTDVSKNTNPFDSFEVGLITEFSSQYLEEYFDHSLENDSKYILKVKPKGKINFSFKCYSEPVSVIAVYKGEGITNGDNIEIVRYSSTIFWDTNNTDSINTGFVNKMNANEEYLVFLSDKLDYRDKTVYKTTSCVIAPIFSYTHHDNSVVNGKNNISSIEYINVKNNEFFVGDNYSLNVLERAKEKFVLKYT